MALVRAALTPKGFCGSAVSASRPLRAWPIGANFWPLENRAEPDVHGSKYDGENSQEGHRTARWVVRGAEYRVATGARVFRYPQAGLRAGPVWPMALLSQAAWPTLRARTGCYGATTLIWGEGATFCARVKLERQLAHDIHVPST